MKKKLLALAMALFLVLGASACSEQTGTQASPSQTGLSPTQTADSGEAGNSAAATLPTQDDPYTWYEALDKNSDKGYDVSSIVSVDDLGRVLRSAGSELEGKSVGIFYTHANGFHAGNIKGIFDVFKIMAEYGPDVLFHQDTPISPNNTEHYWGEPLYGYYKSTDLYVIKNHINQFTAAGIDYIVMDCTNAWLYNDALKSIMGYITELRQDGWDAPQVVLYIHSLNNKTVREAYKDIYSLTEYKDSWYMKDGKPVIIAYTDTEKDIAEASGRGVTDFSSSDFEPLSQEILDFFYFVEPRWPDDYLREGWPQYDPNKDSGYCWIEWTQPLPVRDTSLGTFMNAAVASHPEIPFSFSITRGANNWSRAYDPVLGKEAENGVMEGTYFQACWDQIIEESPDTVFLVAWNFWTAIKQSYMGEYMLCDTATLEYSLSIEMANGTYGDNYYLQMIENMRDYKFTGEAQAYEAQTIDISGSYEQWYDVSAVYRQMGKSSIRRVGASVDNSITYRTSYPDNNIQEVRIAHDDSNIYFMIRTEEAISARNEADNWMNLFIGTGEPSAKGWNGYEYVLNRSGSDTATDIVRLNADFTGEVVGQAEMKINENFMFISVPRELIGMNQQDSFYFKMADSVAERDDIMDYYVTGSVLPLGRLSYEYNMA